MTLLPSCRDLNRLMTDYLEGQLPFPKALAVKVHLGICPPCQAFVDSLQALPGRLRQALGQGDGPAPASARAALDGALARLGQPREPRTGPCCDLPADLAAALAEGTADRPLRAMATVHRALLEDGPVAAAPHLPPATLHAFPPPAAWRWIRPGAGIRFARMVREGPSALYLVHLAPERTAPLHTHRGAEQTLLLHGGLEEGPRHFGPGAWSVQAAGTAHAPHATARGCWALVRVEDGLDFSGWRGWLQRVGGA